MKKILQFFLIPLFLFVSCIGDNMDDCAATRTLVFEHFCHYDPDKNFDTWVGNDVMLYVFQDKTLKIKELIPYERIKDEKPYSYVKRYGGDIDIVAWSVPKGSTTAIPQFEYGDNFNDKHIAHTKSADIYNPFPVDLFMGADSLKNDVLTEPTIHTIRMIHCAYMINFIIDDPNNVMQGSNDNYVLVNGVMDQMNLRYGGCGQEATVKGNVEGTSTIETGYIGVLPSAANQGISYTLYSGGKALANVTTGFKARPGDLIEFNITIGLSISVTVNGEVVPSDWDVYMSVEWL